MHLRIAIAAVCASVVAHAQATPATGRDVLQAMHDAYAGKWYSTLTFIQKTTRKTADGKDTVATWYASTSARHRSATA